MILTESMLVNMIDKDLLQAREMLWAELKPIIEEIDRRKRKEERAKLLYNKSRPPK